MHKLSANVSRRIPRVAIAIMAAGKGTRLKSKLPKVLHQVGGKALLAHVIESSLQVVPAKDVYAIIGHEAARVREAAAGAGINFVLQEEQRGTGHALMAAREALKDYDTILVLSGDAPLITAQTIQRLRDFHIARHAAMSILSARLANPTGYGRIIRKAANGGTASDQVRKIVEEKSLTASQRRIAEVNSGFYAFDVKSLFGAIDQLENDNAHAEYYLTDMASILSKENKRVVVTEAKVPSEILGGNTRAELADIDRSMRSSKAQELMAGGVTIIYPDTCIIDRDVEIGADTVIEPFVQILGKTRIGSECRIRSYSVLEDCEIASGVLIRPGCVLHGAEVAKGASLGPYSHLRPGSRIGEGAHVGNFVETKKIALGKGSKANHLAYLGDAEIGDGVNIGAGTITCNYDGANKHKTRIEDGVFIGSNSTLVAPVTIGKNSYVGAASCVTDNVPADSLAIGRSRQIVKEDWVKRKKAKTGSVKKT